VSYPVLSCCMEAKVYMHVFYPSLPSSTLDFPDCFLFLFAKRNEMYAQAHLAASPLHTKAPS
jgi:hypothetical protein